MWWTLLACQEPFGTDRHDLVGFRVAAVSVAAADPGEEVVPRVAIVDDGRPWTDDLAALRWYWVDDPDEVASIPDDLPPAATGAAPQLVLPDDRGVLALIATRGQEEERAFVVLARPPASIAPPSALTLGALPLSIARVTAPELSLQARRALAAEPADRIAPGAFGRFAAEVEGDPLVRWMATGGTFFELDRHTTDWAAGELRLDGDEIDEDVERTSLDAPWVTVIALALGEPGLAAFRAADLALGTADDAIVGFWSAGRFVPTDTPPSWGSTEQLRGTLVADDASPIGLRLANASAEPLGTPSPPLPCDPPIEGPFDPALLLEQRCARRALDGAEAVLIPEVAP